MAHVEAPTFGSIILAGLLLKMGGCGLLRFICIFRFQPELVFGSLYSYCFFAVLASSFVCCVQADIKRLVAYSSVLHISVVCLVLIGLNFSSVRVVLMLIVFHGLSSPLLFYLVGHVYSLFSTRLLVLVRGALLISPLMGFIIVIVFVVNIPVPPVPSFFAEVLRFISLVPFSTTILVVPLIVLIAVIVYSLT